MSAVFGGKCRRRRAGRRPETISRNNNLAHLNNRPGATAFGDESKRCRVDLLESGAAGFCQLSRRGKRMIARRGGAVPTRR